MWGPTYKVTIFCPNRATKRRTPPPRLDTNRRRLLLFQFVSSFRARKIKCGVCFDNFEQLTQGPRVVTYRTKNTWPFGRHKNNLRETELCSAPGAVCDVRGVSERYSVGTLPLNLAAWMDGTQLQLSLSPSISRALSLSPSLSRARFVSPSFSRARFLSLSLALCSECCGSPPSR